MFLLEFLRPRFGTLEIVFVIRDKLFTENRMINSRLSLSYRGELYSPLVFYTVHRSWWVTLDAKQSGGWVFQVTRVTDGYYFTSTIWVLTHTRPVSCSFDVLLLRSADITGGDNVTTDRDSSLYTDKPIPSLFQLEQSTQPTEPFTFVRLLPVDNVTLGLSRPSDLSLVRFRRVTKSEIRHM